MDGASAAGGGGGGIAREWILGRRAGGGTPYVAREGGGTGGAHGHDFVVVGAPTARPAAERFLHGLAEQHDAGGGIDTPQAAQAGFQMIRLGRDIEENQAGGLAGKEDGLQQGIGCAELAMGVGGDGRPRMRGVRADGEHPTGCGRGGR